MIRLWGFIGVGQGKGGEGIAIGIRVISCFEGGLGMSPTLSGQFFSHQFLLIAV